MTAPLSAQSLRDDAAAAIGLRKFAQAARLAVQLERLGETAEAANLKGRIALMRDRSADAIVWFQKCLALKADHVGAWANLGTALAETKVFNQAWAAFARAIELGLPARLILHNLSVVAIGANQAEAAIRLIAREVADGFEEPQVYTALTDLYGELGDIERQIAVLGQALIRYPTRPDFLDQLYQLKTAICDYPGLAAIEERVKSHLAYCVASSTPPGMPSFSFLMTQDDGAHAVLNQSAWDRPEYRRRPAKARVKPGRLRLAYLSADLHDHPVGRLLLDIISAHDRSRFEIIILSAAVPSDQARHRRVADAIAAQADQVIPVHGFSDDALAKLIRRERVDILVELGGHMMASRIQALWAHEATVQISFMGYAGSSGMRCIDYIVADPVVLPPVASRDFVERVIRLPHPWLPASPEAVSAVPSRQALFGTDARIMVSLQTPQKLSLDTVTAWARILARTDAVLWLFLFATTPGRDQLAMRNLGRFFEERGIAGDRLRFTDDWLDRPDHLARIAAADLALDALRWGGHSTTLDALNAGVPVLTIAGPAWPSRVASSLLRAAGLDDDLVARSVDDYVERAVRLMTDTDCLASITTRTQTAFRAGNLASWTAAYERGLSQAYEDTVRGLHRDIEVQ